MNRRALLLYCTLLYAFSWALQGGAIAFVRDLDAPAAAPWLLSVMYTPMILTLGFVLFFPPSRKFIAWKPTWRILPLFSLAVAVPTLVAFSVLATIEIGHWGHSRYFEYSAAGVSVARGPWVLGKGFQAWPYLITNVAATAAIYSVKNALWAIGEEFGWRGFLQGCLIEKLGTIRAIVLLGLIWSFWHLPILFAGYNYPEHPLLGAFLIFPLECVATSFFLGWLTLRSGSFWLAAIAHGPAIRSRKA